ncbi:MULTISPECIES: hypothetical protein [Enterovibrio]|uniref:hypothetical protein n=1 Tax=Enterovibrio TaxID=188143 RepID=UPI000C822BE8|nr:hypothetical protein [Enterovibrio norvegicus]MCC4796974.1 hypothetical protein [Enterovibrio norvegicus]PMI40710.1 hypothetical protein BCU46_04735 [Enterovibrio norvegicus]
MSRNKQYEQRQNAKGLVKLTVWVPLERIDEFKMLSIACCENRHLGINTLRDVKTGRYVSLERL